MIRLLIAGIFAVLIITAGSTTAIACDCVDKSSDESFEEADIVFIGTAISSDRTERTPFVVNEFLKGSWPRPMMISGGSDCDESFAADVTYLVYAKEVDGRLIAPSCLGTTHLNYRHPKLTSLPDVPGNPGSTRIKTTVFLSRPNVEQRLSYGRIAVITSFCVATSIGLGMLVGAIRRRFS